MECDPYERIGATGFIAAKPGARRGNTDRPRARLESSNRSIEVLDREDEARTTLRALLEADVEPDRRVERRELVDGMAFSSSSNVCASSSVAK